MITRVSIKIWSAVLVIAGCSIGAFWSSLRFEHPNQFTLVASLWPVRSSDGRISVESAGAGIPEDAVANASAFVGVERQHGLRGIFFYKIRLQHSVHWWPDRRPEVDISALINAESEKAVIPVVAKGLAGRFSTPTIADIRKGEVFYTNNIGECIAISGFIIAGLASCVFLRRFIREFVRLEESRCVACGYEVFVVAQQCPECGVQYTPYQLAVAAEAHAMTQEAKQPTTPP